MRALLSITTPAWWAFLAALFALAQVPTWRSFYQSNRPYTDISVLVLSALTLRKPNGR